MVVSATLSVGRLVPAWDGATSVWAESDTARPGVLCGGNLERLLRERLSGKRMHAQNVVSQICRMSLNTGAELEEKFEDFDLLVARNMRRT